MVMENTQSDCDLDALEQHALSLNKQLLQENKDFKEHVERLRILNSDYQEMQEEKHTTLEAFYQSCAREQAVKERLKEEESENDCLLEAIADLKYIIQCVKPRQERLVKLKRAVFKVKHYAEEMEYALAMRQEMIMKRNAEFEELLDLFQNCLEHVEETAARLKEAEEAVCEMEHMRVRKREDACEVKRKETPAAPVKTVNSGVGLSRVQHRLEKVCSLALTLLFLFFFIFCVISVFSREATPAISCTELFLDSVKELITPINTVHRTELPVI